MGSASHAAKRAAELVSVLLYSDHENDEALGERVRETLSAYGEPDVDITQDDVKALRESALILNRVFAETEMGNAAGLLNAILREHAHPPRLSSHDQMPWHLHVDGRDDASWADWFIASSAMALATLLAEKQRHPGGLCASSSCGRPFIDSNRGGGRQYCSTRCATRERVASHRERHRVRRTDV